MEVIESQLLFKHFRITFFLETVFFFILILAIMLLMVINQPVCYVPWFNV